MKAGAIHHNFTHHHRSNRYWLEGNSEYFASCNVALWISLMIDRSESWMELPGHPNKTLDKRWRRRRWNSRRPPDYLFGRPSGRHRFVTLHNILYFIYIGCVNLPGQKDNDVEKPFPEGYPEEADPFLLFRNANKFLLSELKECCLYSLEHGVTVDNVAERLFHPSCQFHEDLKAFYFNYLVANYDAVKATTGWESAFCGSDDECPSAARYRTRLLFTISRKVRL
jgi:hypothetical protein